MKILSMDTSGSVAACAVSEDGRLLAEWRMDSGKTHSQRLLPMLDGLLKNLDMTPADLQAVACAVGPGSFTGLRIGVTTAKTLGWTLGIPVIGVSTLEALALNMAGCGAVVCPMMDARNKQVFTGVYRFEEGFPVPVMAPEGMLVEALLTRVADLYPGCVFGGDAALTYQEDILAAVPGAVISPAPQHRSRAESVAALAWRQAQRGNLPEAELLLPDYLRPSQAERLKGQGKEGDGV